MVFSEEEFEKILEESSKRDAINGYCSLTSECEKDIRTIYIIDREGNVIAEDTGILIQNNRFQTGNEKTPGDWVKWIFENGKENEYTVYTVREEVNNSTYYDPETYAKLRERMINHHNEQVKAEEIKKKRKEERNARWREGCEWVRSQGKTRIPEKYVKRRTLVKYVVKLGIIDQWNEKYPEFKLSEYEEYEWTKYWESKKKRGE